MPDRSPTHYSADGLAWTDDTLWTQFSRLAVAVPEALAVVGADGRRWNRAEMRDMALAVRDALLAGGVGAQDRVMLQGRKTAPVLAAALGISAAGAIICPYTPDLGAAERHVLDERLDHIAVIGDADGEAIAGTPSLRLQLRRRNPDAIPDERNARTALIGFTSGTTGVPKGVMQSAASMNYTVRACEHIAGLAPGDAILGVVPLGSAPGFTFTVHFSLSLGHPLVIVDPWDPLETLKKIAAHDVRWGICVPTHLATMVELARKGQWSAPSPLKALGVGGSSMTPELIRDARELLGIPALRMFGMSECMGHASTRPDDALELQCHSDGKSFPGTQDEAFDSERRMLPRGERGQAGVRGPSLFLGYCRGLGEHEFQLTPDGFYLTGDEIICSADGYLRVVGRIKDQIIRGGYNIDPAEVEAALLRHPAIDQVSIVSVPEPRLGEQACALCSIRDGFAEPTLEDIKRHLGEIGLSKKKWPEHLLIINHFPYTTTGKVDKKRMSKIAVAELGLG
ncbi:class I adenylate-forming enzyme family protein [Aromatoleum diolicum]|uniref:class I adenylate-forming enzyme family protein n=1 Tax=Aromatoleum diolicum TaxID=75796 RepID=UPI001B7CFF6D|nr:AMP-binding protein [Aromatoleum diolicum]